MPHYICRWSSGDVLFASVDSRDKLNSILAEKGEVGSCRVARYNGPVAFELTPKLPGVARSSAKRFKVPESQGLLHAAWPDRCQFSDVKALAADGASEPAHKVVLRSRCPVLTNLTDLIQNVRFQVIPNREVLLAFLEYVYTGDVQQHKVSHHLHMAAIQCRMPQLVALCEARLAQRIEQEVGAWSSYSRQQQQSCADFVLDWIRYCERLQRQDLCDFCCHVISRHLAVAAARPTWAKLQPATQQLVEAVALAAAQPLVERQVASSCGAARVRMESDLYTRAGGRLNEAEWEQLQRYRTGCQAGAVLLPASCPLVMTAQELYDCGLTMDEPALTYELQTSDLEVQKGILSTITKFAFPAVHKSLHQLKQIRQLAAQGQRQEQEQGQGQQPWQAAGALSAAVAASAGSGAAAAAVEEEEWDQAESRQSNQPSCIQPCAVGQEVEQQHCSSSSTLQAQAQRQLHRLHRQTYPHDATQSQCSAKPGQQQQQPQQEAAQSPGAPCSLAGGSITAQEQAQQQAHQQQQAPSEAGHAGTSSPGAAAGANGGSSEPEATMLLRLQQSLVKDLLQYDESAALKDSLARLLVAAEAGCPEAAAKLVSGDLADWADPTSDESCSEVLGSGSREAGRAVAAPTARIGLVEELPFHAGRHVAMQQAACQPAFGQPPADDLYFDYDDLHPSADCDLLLQCGPPDMTSAQSASCAGQKRRHSEMAHA